MENVLTTQVMQALDYLPRADFLRSVFRDAVGADGARAAAARACTSLRLTLLPPELQLPPTRLAVQPDATWTDDSVYVLVEAKRIGSSRFQPQQLVREYVGVVQECAGRVPLLLLVLGAEPPILVQGEGRTSVRDAIAQGLPALAETVRPLPESVDELLAGIDARVAWTTWARIRERVAANASSAETRYGTETVIRLAGDLVRAVDWHGST